MKADKANEISRKAKYKKYGKPVTLDDALKQIKKAAESGETMIILKYWLPKNVVSRLKEEGYIIEEGEAKNYEETTHPFSGSKLPFINPVMRWIGVCKIIWGKTRVINI